MTRRDVERYARLVAQVEDLESERKLLRDKLIAQIRDGHKSPMCPFKLTVSSWQKSTTAWKAIATALGEHRPRLFDKLLAYNTKETEVNTLLVRPNEDWERPSVAAKVSKTLRTKRKKVAA